MSRSRSLRRHRRRRAGFTLMEVMLVLAILVILGAMAFFAFGNTFEEAKRKAAKSQIDAFETPIRLFLLDEGQYPQSLQDLQAGPRTGKNYLDKPLSNDPWDSPYGYEPADSSITNSKCRIWSNGPDHQSGTADDISNMPVNQ